VITSQTTSSSPSPRSWRLSRRVARGRTRPLGRELHGARRRVLRLQPEAVRAYERDHPDEEVSSSPTSVNCHHAPSPKRHLGSSLHQEVGHGATLLAEELSEVVRELACGGHASSHAVFGPRQTRESRERRKRSGVPRPLPRRAAPRASASGPRRAFSRCSRRGRREAREPCQQVHPRANGCLPLTRHETKRIRSVSYPSAPVLPRAPSPNWPRLPRLAFGLLVSRSRGAGSGPRCRSGPAPRLEPPRSRPPPG
jgi:hypothetical protein